MIVRFVSLPRLLLAACVLSALAALPAAAQTAPRTTKAKVLAALPALEALARRLTDDGAVPGLAIGIVYRDEVVYLGGFGVREAGKDGAVGADTVFQLASMSKPIASAVVAALVGDGATTWDTRIATIDAGFELRDAFPSQEVTIRDLFAHRSGLPGEAGNELEEIGYGRDAILARLRLVAPSSSFRAGYSYSNFGLTAGAVAAARAAGMAWEDAAEARLYRPLGMAATSSRHADFLTRADRAALHVTIDGRWQAATTRDPDAQAPAGGVSSTVRDLARWMRLELGSGRIDGRQLIAAEALDATHQPQMALGAHPLTGTPRFYGMGWNINYSRYGTVWGHAGAFSKGARTLVSLLPDEGLGIVVLANAFPTGVPEGVADTFLDLAMTGAATRDWVAPWNGLYDSLFGPAIAQATEAFAAPPGDLPALPPAAYAGTYANDYVGTAVVAEAAGGLELRLGPDGRHAVPLTHFARDLFTVRAFPETPTMPSAVAFAIGPDGIATAVTIDFLNDFGLGTLTRTAP